MFNSPDSMGHARPTLSKSTAIPLYLCILSGCSLGLGLVYAGTGNVDCKQLLLTLLKQLHK